MRKAAAFIAVAGTALILSVRSHAAEPNVPAAPRATVEIPALTTAGRTIRVPSGGDLQKALDQAAAGDRIELAAGATYRGPFTLKAKDGDKWTVITTVGATPQPG